MEFYLQHWQGSHPTLLIGMRAEVQALASTPPPTNFWLSAAQLEQEQEQEQDQHC
jgi:hypothetical protein